MLASGKATNIDSSQSETQRGLYNNGIQGTVARLYPKNKMQESNITQKSDIKVNLRNFHISKEKTGHRHKTRTSIGKKLKGCKPRVKLNKSINII